MTKLLESARVLGTAAVVAASMAVASPGAQAQWGDQTGAEYCSPSLGCMGQIDGRNVYAKYQGRPFTAQEKEWYSECRVAVAGVAGAGAISGTVKGVLGAVWGGFMGGASSCQKLYRSYNA